MTEPLLSVCLITYNHFNYIREAIDGVLMQKVNFSWELIIADDFSKDGTREILIEYKNKYPDFIKLILQEKNVGPAKNWMDLITYPKSKYIAYFEGDDYWIDEFKLQKQIDFLETNLKFVMSFHSANLVYESTLSTNCAFPPPFRNTLKMTDLLMKHQIVTNSLVFLRTAMPQPLPKWFEESRIGDIPLELLIAEKGLTYFHNENMSIYRVNSSSITQNELQRKLGRKSYIFIYKKINKEFKFKYWPYFSIMLLKTYLGYFKDFLGMNKNLK